MLVTREPGGTLLGERLREILLNFEKENPVQRQRPYLCGFRAQLVKNYRSGFTKGSIMLCDRFVDSSLAYQGFARGLGIRKLESVNRWF